MFQMEMAVESKTILLLGIVRAVCDAVFCFPNFPLQIPCNPRAVNTSTYT